GYLPADIPALLRNGLTPTIYDRAGAEAAAAADAPAPVYLKVDAGLGRLGVPLVDAEELILDIATLPNLVIDGIYAPVALGVAAGRDRWRERTGPLAARLQRLADRGVRPPVTQVWASSGLLAGLPDVCNAVCVGHLLYGISTVDPEVSPADGLRP